MENKKTPLKLQDAQEEIKMNESDMLTENVSKRTLNHCTNQLPSKPP